MGNFKVDITLGQTLATSSIKATGTFERALTNDDKDKLGLNSDKVANAIEAIYGHGPTDIYFDKPGGAHKLFEKYGWAPTTVVCTPISAELKLQDADDTTYVGTTIINNSDNNTTGTSSVDNTFSISMGNGWSKESTISISQEIDYGVSLEGVGNIGGKTTFGYSKSYGTNGSVTEQQTVSVTSGIEIDVPPHKAARAELRVGSKKVIATVVFKCYIKGGIACNYKHQKHLNGISGEHHFFHLPIVNILNHAGIKNVFTDVSTITGGYYTDTTIKVVNVEDGSDLHLATAKS